MKKILFSFALFLFASCGYDYEHPSTPPVNTGRFVIIYEQSSFDTGTQIIQDTITGKLYLFHKCGYGGGLTSL